MMFFIVLSAKAKRLPMFKISVFLSLNIGTLEQNLNKKA
jgi:hypothetical protein